MNKQEAEELAQRYLDSRSSHELVVLPDNTIEKPYGWLIDYEWKEYLEGKTKHRYLGSYVLVEKSGNIIRFPTNIPYYEAIRRYEAGEPLVPPRKSQAG